MDAAAASAHAVLHSETDPASAAFTYWPFEIAAAAAAARPRTVATLFTFAGRTMSAAEWARVPLLVKWGIGEQALRQRRAAGWDDEDALTLPLCVHAHSGTRETLDTERLDFDDDARYADDSDARWFVEEAHPGGATLEEVGAAWGVSRERIRQIEVVAVKKLRRAFEHLGIDHDEARELLAFLVARRPDADEAPKKPRTKRAAL